MNVLELFAGSKSFSKEAEKLGMNTFASDYKNFEDIDYVTDILEFDVSQVPFQPDIIWASPPCTFFSVASIGKHWNKDHTPKTENAKHGVKIILKTLEIIKHFNSPYVFIENPRGKLRKLDLLTQYSRATVCYCKYGESRMKPTDIWTNHLLDVFNPEGWTPRDMCFNGNTNCHHEPAPRGSSTGTQGLKGNYLRSVVPQELCLDILKSCKNDFVTL